MILGLTTLSPIRAESLSRNPTTSVKPFLFDKSVWQRSRANGPTPKIKTLLLNLGNETETEINGGGDVADSSSILCSDLLELFMMGFSVVFLLHIVGCGVGIKAVQYDANVAGISKCFQSLLYNVTPCNTSFYNISQNIRHTG